MTSDTNRGLYRKFEVSRTDGTSGPGGKHEGCTYFVLDIDHDPHAAIALRAYAEACRETHPALSDDLERLAPSRGDAATIGIIRKLDSLRAELAEARGRWISTSERLPEAGDESYRHVIAWDEAGFPVHLTAGDGRYYDNGSLYDVDTWATHWQPITPPAVPDARGTTGE